MKKVICIWLVGCALSSAPSVQSLPKVRTLSAEEYLRNVAKQGNILILADVDEAPKIEEELLKFGPEQALQIAGRRFKRQLVSPGGVRVLKRWPANVDASMAGSSAQLLTWAMTLSGEQVKQAAQCALPFDTLSQSDRAVLLGNMPVDQDLAQKIAGNPADVAIGIAFTTSFEFRDPVSGQARREFVSPPMSHRGTLLKPNRPAQSSASSESPAMPEIKYSGQRIEFDGKVMALSELVVKAESAFGCKYAYDSRLRETKVFACGLFDRQLFEQALKEIASAEPMSTTETRGQVLTRLLKESLTGSLSRLADEQKWNLGLNDVLNRQTMSVAEMGQFSPLEAGALKKRGLDSDTQLKLSPALLIYLEAGGQRVALIIRDKGS